MNIKADVCPIPEFIHTFITHRYRILSTVCSGIRFIKWISFLVAHIGCKLNTETVCELNGTVTKMNFRISLFADTSITASASPHSVSPNKCSGPFLGDKASEAKDDHSSAGQKTIQTRILCRISAQQLHQETRRSRTVQRSCQFF